eukprot:scaffold61791_cov59-Phaeocystis_antarctica.AAC.2
MAARRPGTCTACLRGRRTPHASPQRPPPPQARLWRPDTASAPGWRAACGGKNMCVHKDM